MADASLSTTAEQDAGPLRSLLDAEIAHGIAIESRPGWSQWALMASLAAAVWQLIEVSAFASFHNAAATALVSLGAADCIWVARRTSEVKQQHDDGPPRFQMLGSIEAPSIVFGLAMAVRLWAMAIALMETVPLNNSWQILLVFPYMFGGMFAIFIPFQSEASKLVKVTETPFATRMFRVSVFLLSIATIVAAMPTVWHAHRGDLKAGGLAAASLILAALLADVRTQSSGLRALVAIRRRLTLGKVTVADAMAETEIALSGWSTEMVLKHIAGEASQAVERDAAKLGIIRSTSAHAVKLLASGNGDARTLAQQSIDDARTNLRELVRADSHAWGDQLQGIRKLAAELRVDHRAVEKLIDELSQQRAQVDKDAASILKTIDEAAAT